MSATFRILSGAADVRLDGVTSRYEAPAEFAGLQFSVPPMVDTGEPGGAAKARAQALMTAQLEAPSMGSASRPGDRVAGTVEVEAVVGQVLIQVYRDAATSPHPDETFGKPNYTTEDILLQPGEVWTGAVAENNAATVVLLAA